MKKLKLNSRLKKVFISLFLVLVCFVGLCGIGLKANAYTEVFNNEGLRINTDHDSTIIFFTMPSDFSYYDVEQDLVFLQDNYGDVALNLDYRYSINNNYYKTYYYYANNDNTKPLDSEHFYCFRFDNVINRYTFYDIQIEPNASYPFNDEVVNFIELFTVSMPTHTVDYIEIIASGFVSRVDINSSDTIDVAMIFYIDMLNQTPYMQYAIHNRSIGYNQGYSAGYNTGYREGQTGENAISPVWNVLTGIFNSIGAILSIELIPHIPIGLLIFVPLFFIMVMAILSIWRKNW